MEQLLNQLLENSSFPLLTAIALGLMTAFSPCPLATNITAIGYISKDISDRRSVFINGLPVILLACSLHMPFRESVSGAVGSRW